jgi:hypothetical protein
MHANERRQEASDSLRSYDELKKDFDEMLTNWFGDAPLPEIQGGPPSAKDMKEDVTVPLSAHRRSS